MKYTPGALRAALIIVRRFGQVHTAEIISSETGDAELLAALERTLGNFKGILAHKPVRDAAETIAEAEAAIAKAKGGAE